MRNKFKTLLLAAISIALTVMAVSCDDGGANTVEVPNTPGNQSQNVDDNGDNGNSGNSGQQATAKPPACDSHEKRCDGVCRDITTSRYDCGDCGHVCGENEICVEGKCTGCAHEMCDGVCADTTSDPNHCGSCSNVCAPNMACVESECQCDDDHVDCDGDPSNGCEALYSCECVPGQRITDYSGPEGTENVGECKAAILECQLVDDATEYVVLEDEVTPILGTKCDGKDHNCNGMPDDQEDMDHDGFTICDGDCCDNEDMCNANDRDLINPGMMEVPDNQTDDNCNGQVDEPALTFESVTPIAYTYGESDLGISARALAQAMGIIWECQPNSSCGFGLVNATLTRSESTEGIDPRQVNVMSAMRDKSNVARVLPREGNTFAVLSSGAAQDVSHGVAEDDLKIEPYASETVIGGETQRTAPYSRIPAVYAAAHGNKLATHASCPTGNVVPAIFDSVQLHLELKVPVNAKGISFDFRFFSREYPQYLCSAFNDFFLALLTTQHEEMSNYPDHNIAFDMNGNPVSVNNGFFTTCNKVNCANGVNKCSKFMFCPESGYCTPKCDTEMSEDDCKTLQNNACRDGGSAVEAYSPNPFVVDMKTGRGGGTAWLSTTAPVVGGETIALDFFIWDTQDNKFDSTVLIDNFKWLVDETKVNTGFAEEVN